MKIHYRFFIILGNQRSVSTNRMQGIGSRIRKSGIPESLKKVSQAYPENLSTISIYDGKDTIWELQWHEKETENKCYPFPKVSSKICELFVRLRNLKISVVLKNCKESLKKCVKFCGERILRKLPVFLDPDIGQWVLTCDEQVDSKKMNNFGEQKLRKIWSRASLDSFSAYKKMMKCQDELKKLDLWNHFVGNLFFSLKIALPYKNKHFQLILAFHHFLIGRKRIYRSPTPNFS